MGRVKEWGLELELIRSAALTNILGITDEDLCQLEYEVHTDSSSDGNIYGYRIEFLGNNPERILDKISRLEDGSTVNLGPHELNDENEYYEHQLNAIAENDHYLINFTSEISGLKDLNKLTLGNEKLDAILKRQIFIGVIGSVETFLSDAFIHNTLEDHECFIRFVETHPEFKKRKFELRDIFSETKNIKNTAKKIMLDTIYHNLSIVREMYQNTLLINFPNIKDMSQYIVARHDLVHRSGRTKEGNKLSIDESLVYDLIICAKVFVKAIAKELDKNKYIDDIPF